MKNTSTFLLIFAVLACSFKIGAVALGSVDNAVPEEAIFTYNEENPAPSVTAPEDLESEAALLMDAETGQVLFDQNMNQKMYPASTTKILTAILVVENTSPDEILTVSKKALEIDEPDSSNIALVPGERLRVADALYALMLPSANDAANVLAEYVSGSQEAFVELMNEKAREIGALNTHFANPSGLHDDDHYSTAYDIALITRYAMENEEFAKYFGAAHYTMSPTNSQPQERYFTNYQWMLVNTTVFYNDTVLGGKIGYTDEARHTMSTVAAKDGRTLVCVVMHASKYEKFYDTEKLLEYGFEGFYPYTVTSDRFAEFAVPIGAENNALGNAFFSLDQDVTLLLPMGTSPENLKIVYEKPSVFEQEEDAASAIAFQLDAPEVNGLADTLLRVPMNVSVRMDAVEVLSPPAALQEAQSPFSRILPLLTAARPFFVIAAAVVVLLWAIIAIKRRRSLQRRRLARRGRMAQRDRGVAGQAPRRNSREGLYSYTSSTRTSGSWSQGGAQDRYSSAPPRGSKNQVKK